MKKNKGNITDALLVNYLSGELKGKEKTMAESMIDNEAEGRQSYMQLQAIWSESGKLGVTSRVDADAAWLRFREGIAQKAIKPRWFLLPHNKWMRVAAALLIVLALGKFSMYRLRDRNVVNSHVYVMNKPVTNEMPAAEPVKNISAGINNDKAGKEQKKKVESIGVTNRERPSSKNIAAAIATGDVAKDPVCNSTRSPIEICIIQKLHCAGESSVIPTCSRLNPNESGQIRYKVTGDQGVDCEAIVNEIIIKKVSTGETLVLNDKSPVSAKELFSYMTGEKKGDITAGEFSTDCLAFNSSSGDFVLQPCDENERTD